jgi:hypothetical protein
MIQVCQKSKASLCKKLQRDEKNTKTAKRAGRHLQTLSKPTIDEIGPEVSGNPARNPPIPDPHRRAAQETAIIKRGVSKSLISGSCKYFRNSRLNSSTYADVGPAGKIGELPWLMHLASLPVRRVRCVPLSQTILFPIRIAKD